MKNQGNEKKVYVLQEQATGTMLYTGKGDLSHAWTDHYEEAKKYSNVDEAINEATRIACETMAFVHVISGYGTADQNEIEIY